MKKLLPRNIALLVDVAADNRQARYAAEGVRIRLLESGYIAEATNGKILVRIEGEYLGSVEEYPHPIPDVKNDWLEGLIPTSALVAISKRKMKPCGNKMEQILAINIGDQEAVLMVGDLEQVAIERTRLVDGRFPNTDNVFPKEKGRGQLGYANLAPKLLLQLVKLLDKLMEEPKGRAAKTSPFSARLEWEFRGKNEPVVVRGTTALGQKVTAIIMPLT